jgi:hypothetical protein
MVGRTDSLCLLHHLFGNPTQTQVPVHYRVKAVAIFTIFCDMVLESAHEKNLKQQFKFHTMLFIYVLQMKMRVKIFIVLTK